MEQERMRGVAKEGDRKSTTKHIFLATTMFKKNVPSIPLRTLERQGALGLVHFLSTPPPRSTSSMIISNSGRRSRILHHLSPTDERAISACRKGR